MRILVIEDEAKTAKFLQKGLGEAGFVVDVAADGLDGLYLAQELQFDLVILDVMFQAWTAGRFSLVCGSRASAPWCFF